MRILNLRKLIEAYFKDTSVFNRSVKVWIKNVIKFRENRGIIFLFSRCMFFQLCMVAKDSILILEKYLKKTDTGHTAVLNWEVKNFSERSHSIQRKWEQIFFRKSSHKKNKEKKNKIEGCQKRTEKN